MSEFDDVIAELGQARSVVVELAEELEDEELDVLGARLADLTDEIADRIRWLAVSEDEEGLEDDE